VRGNHYFNHLFSNSNQLTGETQFKEHYALNQALDWRENASTVSVLLLLAPSISGDYGLSAPEVTLQRLAVTVQSNAGATDLHSLQVRSCLCELHVAIVACGVAFLSIGCPYPPPHF